MKRTFTGKRNRRVTLLMAVTQSDGGGGRQGTWEPQFTCWAHYEPYHGFEGVSAGAATSRQSGVFTVRAGSRSRGISTDWRLDDHTTGRTFNIRDVQTSDGRAEVRLICEVGVPA